MEAAALGRIRNLRPVGARWLDTWVSRKRWAHVRIRLQYRGIAIADRAAHSQCTADKRSHRNARRKMQSAALAITPGCVWCSRHVR